MQASCFNHGGLTHQQQQSSSSHHVRLDLEVATIANLPSPPPSSSTSCVLPSMISTARFLPSSAVQEDSITATTTTTTTTDDDDVTTRSNNNLRDLPPVLQQITDERKNFQMNLGKAMDTIRKDMPYILKRTPGTCR
jgi:hypothetical protein